MWLGSTMAPRGVLLMLADAVESRPQIRPDGGTAGSKGNFGAGRENVHWLLWLRLDGKLGSLFVALRPRLYIAPAHGRGVGQLLEPVHRHRSSAVQLFFSILIDQDHQELSRFDFEVVAHSCQLIFAKAGSVDPGARNGLVVTFRDDRNVQQIAAPEFGCVGLELIKLIDQLRIVHRGSEDQQWVVAVTHGAQGTRLRRAPCCGLWVPGLPSLPRHRSQAKAREQSENGGPQNQRHTHAE